VSNVAEPRKSAPVRIKWTNDAGKSVPADIPPGHEDDPGYAPLAEPEHPQDGSADADGWVTVFGLYRAPSQATRATLELHLQWAPRGSVAWRNVEFIESPPPPPREVKLAAVHYQPTGKSPRQNCEEFAPFIVEAARQQADLVVLGETIPYVRVNKPPHETAEPVPGPTTVYFGTLAKQHRLHIVLSLYEMESDIVYNTAVLVGPEGSLIGKYRKVCLPHSEIEAGVTPGTEYPVFDTALGKVGMMVCYDGFYPEVARELSNRGAEIIAWPVWGCNPLLARARACENHVFLVSSTFSQGKDWMTTAVFDRAGRPLVEADQNGEVIVTTVDLSRPHFWKNNLGDFRSMIPRHRP
jgi:predicted amidohydrolase